jgi:hypothetical protein
MPSEISVVSSSGEESIIIVGTPFSISLDGVEYEPAVVKDLEVEFDAQNEEVSDQCGRTEFLQTGTRPARMKAQIIITDNNRRGNLSLDILKQLRDAIGSDIRVTSELYSGAVELSNILINQSSDIVQIDVGSGMQTAYGAQIQLGESESG